MRVHVEAVILRVESPQCSQSESDFVAISGVAETFRAYFLSGRVRLEAVKVFVHERASTGLERVKKILNLVYL
jgi:hypothetical protein